MRHCFDIIRTGPPSKEYCENYDRIDWHKPDPAMKEFDGKTVARAGYLEDERKLRVDQANGDKMTFYGVAKKTWEAFLAAPDKDEFYWTAIRGRYSHMRQTYRLKQTV